MYLLQRYSAIYSKELGKSLLNVISLPSFVAKHVHPTPSGIGHVNRIYSNRTVKYWSAHPME